MRVTYFHQHFSTRSGQAGTRSYEFARHMVDEGDHVDMICGRNQKSNFDFEASGRRQVEDVDGITVRVMNVPYAPQMGFLARVLAFFSYACRATIEGLRCEKPDIVFASSTPITVGIPGLLVSLLRRRPLIFEVRDIWPESAVAMGVLKNPILIKLAELFERMIYWRATMIIALSNRMKERLASNTNTPLDKIVVIPIGSDMALFGNKPSTSFRQKNGFDDKFLAVFPGAHGKANGLEVIVQSALLLPESINIALIGEGPTRKGLMNLAQEMKADRISFHDPIPKLELANILGDMDCGLMILKPVEVFETVLPNKFFDMASARLPILVNFSGEVADQVVCNNAGLFVEDSSPQNIADALIKMASNPTETADMGANALNVAKKFDREIMAIKFKETLSSILTVPKKEAQ